MAPLVAPPRLAAKPLVAKPNGDCNRYQMKGIYHSTYNPVGQLDWPSNVEDTAIKSQA